MVYGVIVRENLKNLLTGFYLFTTVYFCRNRCRHTTFNLLFSESHHQTACISCFI